MLCGSSLRKEKLLVPVLTLQNLFGGFSNEGFELGFFPIFKPFGFSSSTSSQI